MPDYLDIVLCKKDGSIFYEMDIQRRAINIPLDFQLEGLVMEINITNCDGTKFKKNRTRSLRKTTAHISTSSIMPLPTTSRRCISGTVIWTISR